MKRLRISADLSLPALEAQTQTIVVYGGKGMGKTNFGAVFAEELAASDLRFSWFDPVGVAWGLKHSADGKGPGLEVLILGGTHGGIPINPNAGAIVADLVVDEEVSVIVDVSRHGNGQLWTNGEKIRFARDYFLRLYQRQGERKRPLMQIVDEAGRFVPQDIPRGAVDIMECVGAIEQLVELGRNAGVGVTLITQRSARMRKSVSELAEMMLAFRTVGPRSLNAIEDWFEEHIERKHALELRNRIRELPRGTAMIVSPGWLEVEGEYAIRARETFDSSETPVAGKERRPSGRGSQVDLAKYEARMTATIEQTKAEDPRELRGRIAELQRELAKRPTEVETKVETVVERFEVPVLNGQLEQLEDAIASMRDVAEPVMAVGQSLRACADAIATAIRDSKGVLHDREGAHQRDTTPAPQHRRDPRAHRGDAERPSHRPRPQAPVLASDTDFRPSGPQQRILNALASLETIGLSPTRKVQLALFSGASPKSSTYTNNLGSLRSAGLIDYPAGGLVELTRAGRAIADSNEAAQSVEDLHAYVYALVGGAKSRLLEQLIAVYPDALAKLDLADRAGASATSSTFTNNLGVLRSLGLIEYPQPGYVAALPVLFLEGG